MRPTILSILLTYITFIGCDSKKEDIAQLEHRNSKLEREKSDLIDRIEFLENKMENLESELSDFYDVKFDLEACRLEYQMYRYGSGIRVSRFVQGRGMVTVQGAENVIDFLNDHYCP